MALEEARWPSGFSCPRCQGNAHSHFQHRGLPTWQCSRCRLQTSLLAGTVFENSKLPLSTWFLALYLLAQTKNNVAALELSRHLGVCYRTAWRIKHKLMQAMTAREANRLLKGWVEVDDAYLGGERNGGTPGRGSENKQAIVIAVETTYEGRPRRAVITPLASFTKSAITTWVERHLHPDAEVYSDGLGCFNAFADRGHAHSVIRTGGGRAATRAGGARWVNTVLSNIKRSLDGTYHAIRFEKYAHRYLAEAAWRFNRRFNLTDILPRLLVTASHCEPWTERRLRLVTAVAG